MAAPSGLRNRTGAGSPDHTPSAPGFLLLGASHYRRPPDLKHAESLRSPSSFTTNGIRHRDTSFSLQAPSRVFQDTKAQVPPTPLKALPRFL